MKNKSVLSNSYALVTGASSGIGKAIAFELADRKINVLLVALPNTGLPEIAEEAEKIFGISAKYVELDLTHEGSISFLHQWCNSQNISVQILINNAGIGTQSTFEQTTLCDLETMLRLNNHALVLMSYYFLNDLKRNRESYILNVGSLASFMSIPGKAVYSATKSFIYSFTHSLRIEVKSCKVNVSCLCPGGTITSSRVQDNVSKLHGIAKGMMQQPEHVAREAVAGMFNKKMLIIPGIHNRFIYFLWKMLPGWIVDKITRAIFFGSHEYKYQGQQANAKLVSY